MGVNCHLGNLDKIVITFTHKVCVNTNTAALVLGHRPPATKDHQFTVFFFPDHPSIPEIKQFMATKVLTRLPAP